MSRERFKLLFKKGSFVRNITLFTGGSFLAYAIGILFTPFITRIFTPEDYGALAFFNSTLAILLGISSLNYNESLILPEKKKDFYALGQVMIFVAAGIGGIIMLALVLFKDSILTYFNVGTLGNLIYLLPIILVMGIFQKIAENLNIREKSFSTIASARIVSITSAKSFVLSTGLIAGSVTWGLIGGEVVIRLINTFIMSWSNRKEYWKSLFDFDLALMKDNAIKFKEYPLLIFPASILNQITLQLPVYVIGRIYSNAVMGFYALANSLISLPIQIIGFSMGKVFFQKLRELQLNDDLNNLSGQFIKFHYGIVLVSSLIYAVIYVTGPEIFEIFAGQSWRESGEIAAIMSPALVFQLIALPISPVFRVMRKEKYQFYANLSGSILIITVLLSTILMADIPSQNFFYLLASLVLIKEWIVIMLVFRCIGINLIKHFMFTVSLVAVVFVCFHFMGNLLFSL